MHRTGNLSIHRHRLTLLAAVATLVVSAGCGTKVDTTAGPSTVPTEPTSVPESTTTTAHGDGDDDQLVVQVNRVGGFAPVGLSFSSVPTLTIYADGRVISVGPQIAIYPPPALPNLLVDMLSDEQLDTVRSLADDQGLLSDPPDYGRPPVADATTTLVTLQFDDSATVHEAYALGLHTGPPDGGGTLPGIDDKSAQARQALRSFLDELRSIVGAGIHSEPFKAQRFAIRATPVPNSPTPETDPSGIDPDVEAWPIDEVSLAEAGTCALVDGASVDDLRHTLARANQLTRFEQGEVTYTVAIRPLLPHEHECADIV